MVCCYCYGLITTISDSRFCMCPSKYPISMKRPECIKFPTRNGAGKVKASVKNIGLLVASTQREMSFYELLGVPETVSLVEVKNAYKQLARKYHPDVSPPGRVEEYTKRFIELHEAYETLSDPTTRAIYDRDLHFTFPSRPRHYYHHHHHHQVIEQKNEWESRWQSQLSELKRRSKCRDSGGNMSWAARLRQKRDGLANEL